MSSYLKHFLSELSQQNNRPTAKALRFHLTDQDRVSIDRWKKDVVNPALIEHQRGTRMERLWRTVDGVVRPYEGPSGGTVSYFFIPNQHLLIDVSGDVDIHKKGILRVNASTGHELSVREDIEPNSYFFDWFTIPHGTYCRDYFVVTTEEQDQIREWIYSTVYPILIKQQEGTPLQERWMQEENGRVKPVLDPNELPIYEFTPTSIGTVKIFKYFNQRLDYSNYDEW